MVKNRGLLYFFAGLVLILIISLPELIDLYKYYASGPCNPSCVLEYRVSMQTIGANGVHKETVYIKRSLNGQNSLVGIEAGSWNTSFPVKLREAGNCSNGGYRLTPSAPSLYHCGFSNNNVSLDYIALEEHMASKTGFKYILVSGIEKVYERRGALYAKIELTNTSCAYSCFQLNTRYYGAVLALKLVAAITIVVAVFLAKRVWSAERGEGE